MRIFPATESQQLDGFLARVAILDDFFDVGIASEKDFVDLRLDGHQRRGEGRVAVGIGQRRR